MLVSALKATKRDATIAICGLAASTDMHTELPFILRGAARRYTVSIRCQCSMKSESVSGAVTGERVEVGDAGGNGEGGEAG